MRQPAAWSRSFVSGLALLFLGGCGDDLSAPRETSSRDLLTCSIPTSEIFDGGPGKDGIPALTNPELAAPAMR